VILILLSYWITKFNNLEEEVDTETAEDVRVVDDRLREVLNLEERNPEGTEEWIESQLVSSVKCVSF